MRLTAVGLLGLLGSVGIGVGAPPPAFAAVATCSGLSYAGCDLQGVNFSNQNLAGADFAGANLAGADFSGANLAGADFAGANLQSATFAGDNLTGANFSSANLQSANLQGIFGQDTNFDNANLSNADLGYGLFDGCTDVNAILTGINLLLAVGFCNGSPPAVVPTLNCISKNANGSFIAYFGYVNSGSTISYPIGSTNSVAPSNLNGGQPVTFVHGTVTNAFDVTVPSSGTAQWSVNGASAMAASWSTACAGSTLPADPDGMSLVLAIGGGGIVGAVVVRRTARGRSPA